MLRRLAAGLLATSFLPLLASGCSSTPKDSGGLEAPAATPAGGAETNPYGAAYPTTDLGYQHRAGSTPGNRIRNYRFLGYKESTPGAELTTISLADFYDPEGRTHKVIHLIASSVWCGPCNQETRAVVGATGRLGPEGVVFVQALIDGPVQGTAATTKDLDGWITKHGIAFTTMLDPDVRNLGQFFNAAAVPWNAILDARSMEILDAQVGGITDIDGAVGRWVDWVNENPPKP